MWANAISGVVRIRVRRIRHVRYLILFKPFQYIFSFYGKQWPNHVISPILHAREAAKTRAAHEIMEDGLRLIIEMMRHRDPGGRSGIGYETFHRRSIRKMRRRVSDSRREV